MLQMLVALQAFALSTKDRFSKEEGAAVVEYGIVLAFVVIALGGILFALQTPITAWFNRIATAIGGLRPTT